MVVLTVAVLDRTGLINLKLLTPGVDADSSITASPSGLQTIDNRLTLLRGCDDDESLRWVESTNIWNCATASSTAIANGDPNTIYSMDSAGTTQSFRSDIQVPGDLIVDGSARVLTLGVSGSATLSGSLIVAETSIFEDAATFTDGNLIAGPGVALDLHNNTDLPSNQVAIFRGNERATPQDDDEGYISFVLDDDGGSQTEFARIVWVARDTSVGTIDGSLRFNIHKNSVSKNMLTLASGVTTFNEGSANTDFRFEGGSDIRLLLLDAGLDVVSIGGGGVSGSKLSVYGDLGFPQASSITSAAGNITINPTTSTDVSSDPLLLQNVSQNTTPGTTTDGQIRLWHDADVGGVDGRIVFQVNGTTYQVNADAGLTFSNNPLLVARDKALFDVGRAQWKLDKIDDLDDIFQEFKTLFPGLGLTDKGPPRYTVGYLNHLRAQYRVAQNIFNAQELADPNAFHDDPRERAIPGVPTIIELDLENPWPDSTKYKVAGETQNETESVRTHTPFAVDDPVVMVVDRLETAPSGETETVHMVPSTLTDEFIWLLQNDAAFLMTVRNLLTP